MAHLFNPLYVAVDGNGLAMAGAKLYFYTTGTSTPLDTYSDSSLTAPFVNTNPVVANADGLFGPIYMALDANYKIILKTSADVTVATRDPYSPGSVSFAEGGTNGQIPMINTGNTDNGFDWVSPLNGQLYGLNTSNNTGDATNDIDIAAGGCMDSTGVTWIQIAATTKQLDVVWAADNGASPTGMLDTGAVANNTYHLYAIKNPTTGATAVLASLSVSAPTLPAGYTLFRRFFSIVRTGGAIKAYKQNGDNVRWVTPALDYSSTVIGATTRQSKVLTVPLGLVVFPMVSVMTTSGAAASAVLMTSLDETDTAISQAALHSENFAGASNSQMGFDATLHTDTSGRIGVKVNQTDASVNLQTWGYVDRRGRDA
jgi:hypothetical protein